ncbi:LPXTG cell wall anchor domain-containing protein, partial [Micromonospora sp. 4G55]|nr:LPXTG cell wall anchor domain-containing protein [Micromonospora sp. 4G55]
QRGGDGEQAAEPAADRPAGPVRVLHGGTPVGWAPPAAHARRGRMSRGVGARAGGCGWWGGHRGCGSAPMDERQCKLPIGPFVKAGRWRAERPQSRPRYIDTPRTAENLTGFTDPIRHVVPAQAVRPMSQFDAVYGIMCRPLYRSRRNTHAPASVRGARGSHRDRRHGLPRLRRPGLGQQHGPTQPRPQGLDGGRRQAGVRRRALHRPHARPGRLALRAPRRRRVRRLRDADPDLQRRHQHGDGEGARQHRRLPGPPLPGREHRPDDPRLPLHPGRWTLVDGTATISGQADMFNLSHACAGTAPTQSPSPTPTTSESPQPSGSPSESTSPTSSVTPTESGSPSESGTPSTSGSPSQGTGGNGGSNGGDLPMTGVATGSIALGGLVLIGGGVLLMLRRRRDNITFTS